MHTSSIITDDFMNAIEGVAEYQGRHVRRDEPIAMGPASGAAPILGGHPRRRGFGILSRLARVNAESAERATELDLHAPTMAV